MGCEVAVRRGVGTMVLDVRRGDGPTAARHYTFSALVATDKTIKDNPAAARAAVRALMKAHKALKQDPARATAVGQKRFPASEAELIAELVRRDLPYYDPTIPPEKVASMNRFAQDIGLLKAPAPMTRWSPSSTAAFGTNRYELAVLMNPSLATPMWRIGWSDWRAVRSEWQRSKLPRKMILSS